ncbi:hypothetical protein ACFL1H_03175 [Nanoarchaeota archaeon]
MTEEDLEKITVGAILAIDCPDCKEDIFYTLINEYYKAYKEKDTIPMLLRCSNCKDYKPDANPAEGEILYEKEGDYEQRDTIPMSEHIPPLPKKPT